METVISHFGLKDEDDFLYKKGAAKKQAEAEQKQRFMVIKLIDTMLLTEAQIINICEISDEFIQDIKKDLAAVPRRIARLKKTLTAEKIAEQLNLPLYWVEKQLQQA